MSYKKEIEVLKNMVMTEKDFSKTVEYFLDHLFSNEHFRQQSLQEKKENTMYQAFLEPIVKNFNNSKITDLRAFQIRKHSFVHGSAQLSLGTAVNFFYFEDIQMGIALMFYQDRVHFFRLTAFIGKSNEISDKAFIGVVNKSLN